MFQRISFSHSTDQTGQGRKHIQFEEGIRDLQHEDVRVVVLVADEDALAGPSHSVLVIVLLEPLQSCEDRWVFFWLRLLGAERVVAQRIKAYSLGLVRIEVQGLDRTIRLSARSTTDGVTVFMRLTGKSSAELSWLQSSLLRPLRGATLCVATMRLESSFYGGSRTANICAKECRR